MEYIRLLCSLSVYFSLSVSSVSSDCVPFASLSLSNEWRLSTEYIQLLLSVYFSLSVSSASSDCVAFASLSLPNEWRLRSRAQWNPLGFEREK
jgi:hypothetical protein